MNYKYLMFEAVQYYRWNNGLLVYDHERSQSLALIVNSCLEAEGLVPTGPPAMSHQDIPTDEGLIVILRQSMLALRPAVVRQQPTSASSAHAQEIPPAVEQLIASAVEQGHKVNVRPYEGPGG